MAFQMDIQTDMGFSFPNSYCYIHAIGGSKELLHIQVNWYVDQEARLNNLKPVTSKGFSFVPNVEDDSLNFIKQGYIYLKTLDEFSNTIDIL
jgi:hypothetical protein